ncbi:MAG: 1-(5-phosphoribosyl)-5-[(5-phosphoribosylamino)methylideneamino]imidazole-4-carboxamide isomerase [Actinobacteria bacterium]|nr:1-(5-phosphoribosyl)-5-[(5-phosphoribosylamino)methylideneamino]imidazole-4-carboxamide isomerase [Actinomycetota bacterium]
MFRIYPAVDIKGGRTVRLYRGDLDRETVYAERPWEAAVTWQNKGASFLHVVDLDGAAKGELVNLAQISEILERVNLPVQCGGGVRSRDDIEGLLELGVERVILGTRAVEEPAFAEEMIGLYGSRIIVSLDTREGAVATGAWRKTARREISDILNQLAACGAERIIHTDIARDGTLEGYDTGALEAFLDRGMGIIAAGGISDLSDLRKLKGLAGRGLEGAIVGRAIYTGDIDLAEALMLEGE